MRISVTTLFHSLPRLLLLWLFTSTVLLSGCSKSNTTDPVPASFVGDYKGKIVVVTKAGSQTFTQTLDKLTVSVKSTTTAGAYTVQLIDDQYGEISDPLKTTLSGTTITLPKQTTSGYPDSEYEGTGTLVGNALTMAVTVRYKDGSSEVDTITATKP